MDPAQTTGASPPPELLELAELRSQLARYRAAFELSVPGQALIGLTGRFLEANASLCQILGYSQAELQSRRFRYITRPAITRASTASQRTTPPCSTCCRITACCSPQQTAKRSGVRR